jgi:hypothetical protein
MTTTSEIFRFVQESNRIEGIFRDPTPEELEATEAFALSMSGPYIEDVIGLVSVFAPGHRLRDTVGLDVRVGNYVAPLGSPEIRSDLERLLYRVRRANLRDDQEAYECHIAYEKLHPFTDGNGRSGRAIWLRMMGGRAPLGFLHKFYYQTLAAREASHD